MVYLNTVAAVDCLGVGMSQVLCSQPLPMAAAIKKPASQMQRRPLVHFKCQLSQDGLVSPPPPEALDFVLEGFDGLAAPSPDLPAAVPE